MKCSRCGKDVKLIAGIKCPKCEHDNGSQNLDVDWDQYDSDLGRQRARDADSQNRPYKGNYQRRRNSLDFND
jgi:hypothetical protein